MLIRLLGKPEVIVDGACVDLGTPRQRVTLAVLLLADGMSAPVDAMVDRIWDSAPPTRCRNLVATYVSRLRRILAGVPGEPVRISHRHGTYAVTCAPETVDLYRFRASVRRGRATLARGDGAQAARDYREALDLWQGPALAGLPGTWIAQVGAQLDGERRDAHAARVELLLGLGQTELAATELHPLVLEHPLDERFAQQLMAALHASGRDAQAFEVYDALCRRLREHLGVEPSTAVQALHVGLLRAQAPAQPGPLRRPPAQLPNDTPGFIGRGQGLHWLDGLLDGQGGTTAVISAVAGMAGVGKTALAVRWGHRVRDRFVDGQLYINLQGYGPAAPMAPAAALGQFLRALGVPAEKVPTDGGEAAALYRSEMAARQMLVVLDNAVTADQVRPLLPGTPGCVVLVTSRDLLTGLVAVDGARRLDLDVLPPAESVALLARILGEDRVAAAGDGAAQLAQACGHLPLALRIAGANLLKRSDVELGRYAATLTGGERLDALRVAADERASVRAAFDASCRRLPTDAARGLRLLGLHIGPDLSVAAMASLFGVPEAQATHILAELTRAHLIDEHQPGRFALHDLVRAYAADLARSSTLAAEGRAATVRLLDHYLHTAYGASLLLDPDRDPPALAAPASGAQPERPADYAGSLDWFNAEHAVLLAAVDHAAANGFDTHAWLLAWTMTVFLDRQGHWQDWAATARTAVAATERLGDRTSQATAHRFLAGAYLRLREFGQARVHFGRALELFEQTGDRLGQARTSRNLAQTWSREGRHVEALEQARRALHLYRAANHRPGQASILNTIGWYSGLLGDYRATIRYCERALALLLELGHRPGQADAWDSLAYAHFHLGDHDQAIACYERAADLFSELGHRYEHAETLVRLADTYRAAGKEDAAGDCRRRALDMLIGLNQADADRLLALLRDDA